MVWWLWQAVDLDDLGATFTPFSDFNVGTVLIQAAIVLVAFRLANRWLSRHATGAAGDSGVGDSIPGDSSAGVEA